MAPSKTSRILVGSSIASLLFVSLPAQASPWAKSGDFASTQTVEQVRWRGRRNGAYGAAAIGLGILGIAAAAAASQRGGYYADEGYGYAPQYGYGYSYGPAYDEGFAPAYSYGSPYRYGFAPAYGYGRGYAPRHAYAPGYGYADGQRYHQGYRGDVRRGGLTREQQSRDRMERNSK